MQLNDKLNCFFAVMYWGGGTGTGGASKLSMLVRKASCVAGEELDHVEAWMTEIRMFE